MILQSDKPKEECAIYGIYNSKEAANFTYLGLYSMQHRGQESSGIVSTDGSHLYRYANMGLVANIFTQPKIKELIGDAAIGHNRYSTTGASFLRNAQPIRVESHLGPVALAHNGNLVNSWDIRNRLERDGSIFQTTIDSEVIVHLMAKSHKTDLLEALCESLAQVRGAYSLLVLTPRYLIAVRDPNGFRPLVMGKRSDGAIVFASETCAFDITDTEYVRDVEPGEMVVIDHTGMRSLYPFPKAKPSLCIFEYIYFARPDSYIFEESVYKVRKSLGRQLARVMPVEADVIIPVPDSANIAALGYSEESGIPYQSGLIRSHYIGRTFIEPDQKIRDFGAKIKYNVVKEVVNGKRVVIIDDSVMRGTTSRKIIKMIRNAGAKEIHFRVSAPPTVAPCYYGIDIPTHKELIASTHTIEEIQKYLRVDSLAYLTLDTMHKAVEGHKGGGFCDACFTSNYPVEFQDHAGNQKSLFTEYATEE
ncbi:amidophosphoribosyltransferase [Leptospira sp. 2 VSF19]|uniref:Amidophosphoribosyltransferase n=1 Tax=Leptospira soteropolitanensis TaxID=2950025 RepID=A0AAW5VK59_9LEPT|nr:amidophosphoribosyltransferase [Leptospira soteropolitanensis]MCW7491722.1 amidophosphoribosyltransferase [Leptospira soteropolitanensis]MCW7499307.1 amidophosphoribosyltransferase [Leptospira soteropolitanensis]MCW7521102.1 amidophosphoribosyltransferase [Leptospira soteropolitanensis]MCW7525410.1 amidophosphoribosyltransferase [Leptospira soteropolitanensis]MCW7529277.1 amidophosphoribosyltransferase [Leptospira soteropolitanensis]